MNIGWKFAAVLKGYGGAALLDSYEVERQPNARRNTAYAKQFADSLGLFKPAACIEDPTPEGEAARGLAGQYFEAHARRSSIFPA